ncbi:DUF1127 domain-containing protein [Thiolinea disciformis]|uniref:DUF1127 domain-containing protein n=1 Tax=Thiolinea disciformis TaxID=125614 RepID=UPI00035C61B3|nr:DUF1127 domain-containing protein [Thiolinea disciformis]
MIDIKQLFGGFFHLGNANSQHSESELRKAIRSLQAMNDRELEDIGITRGQIEDAVRRGIVDPRQAA